MSLPRPGDVVAGKYTVDGVLGRGGFATVFRATDRTVARQVAIKVLDPRQGDDVSAIEGRFKREARVLASLSDSHTLRLFDFGVDRGLMFMVFELLGGEDLSSLLKRTGTMSQQQTVHIVRQLLSSLREAHQAGLLHRDIKPSNIRIFEYNGDPLYVKVMDFGIARSFATVDDTVTRTGHAVGTPRYMSPEQLVGLDLTPASDLYSVALVALEMLTGDPRAALDKAYGGRRLQLPNASPQLTRLLERMTAPPADARPQTADAVLRALDEVEAAPPPLRPPNAPHSPNYSPDPYAPNPYTPSGYTPAVAPRAQASSSTTHDASVEAPAPAPQMLRVFALAVVLGLALAGVIVVVATRAKGPVEPVLEELPESHGSGAPANGTAELVDWAREEEPAQKRQAEREEEPVEAEVEEPVVVTGCGKPIVPGRFRRQSAIVWELYVPRSYQPEEETALLVALHGSGGVPRDLIDDVGMREWADRERVILVAPKSDGWSFEGASTRPLLDMIDVTREELCVDADQIFVLGQDTGGAMVHALSCSGVAAGSATTSYRAPGQLPCDDPRPQIIFTPKLSKHLPLDGSGQCVGLPMVSLEEYEWKWRKAKGLIAANPKPYKVKGNGKCTQWAEDDRVFVSCLVDGGHRWYGMAPRDFDVFRCDGPPSKFPYLETMWDFWQKHLPPKEPAAEE